MDGLIERSSVALCSLDFLVVYLCLLVYACYCFCHCIESDYSRAGRVMLSTTVGYNNVY